MMTHMNAESLFNFPLSDSGDQSVHRWVIDATRDGTNQERRRRRVWPEGGCMNVEKIVEHLDHHSEEFGEDPWAVYGYLRKIAQSNGAINTADFGC